MKYQEFFISSSLFVCLFYTDFETCSCFIASFMGYALRPLFFVVHVPATAIYTLSLSLASSAICPSVSVALAIVNVI